MPPEVENSEERARTASSEELKSLVHAANPEVLFAVLENPALEESHVTSLLERLDLPVEVLTAMAGESKWISSESVRLRLASHPRTPKRIALPTARQLYLFDLVRLSLLPSAPADIRRAADEILISRVPHLPVGQKLTLARRGPARVAGAILAEGHAQAVKLALNNAFLTESQILKVLARSDIPERVVAAIAQHAKWSCQYNVRMALLQNPNTPIPCVLSFLPQLRAADLKEIGKLEDLPQQIRKYVEQKLKRPEHEGQDGSDSPEVV
ncbi:MAG TPA: hypothetical protein VG322_10535 [Candidatus Acidoferrales bacterium]|jgi:hypothetical protein|nr:hypothetical protein [Candidatus Acidoferrales bacterium]